MNKDWSYCQRPSDNNKIIIADRDNYQCQYCGRNVKRHPIYEHVVPRNLGGPSEPFNVVISCFSCNKKKGSNVWIPNNFDKVTAGMEDWRAFVFEMSLKFFPNKNQKVKSAQPQFRSFEEWDQILMDAIATIIKRSRQDQPRGNGLAEAKRKH